LTVSVGKKEKRNEGCDLSHRKKNQNYYTIWLTQIFICPVRFAIVMLIDKVFQASRNTLHLLGISVQGGKSQAMTYLHSFLSKRTAVKISIENELISGIHIAETDKKYKVF